MAAGAPRLREHHKEGTRSGGINEPFRCLGFAVDESHQGYRPMAIRCWLERPPLLRGFQAAVWHDSNVGGVSSGTRAKA